MLSCLPFTSNDVLRYKAAYWQRACADSSWLARRWFAEPILRNAAWARQCDAEREAATARAFLFELIDRQNKRKRRLRY